MKDNQDEQLFQELGNEVAAICTGGAAYLYQDDGFNKGNPKARRLKYSDGSDDLKNWNFNDQTSSIVITGGQTWDFYPDRYNVGIPVTLGPGEYNRAALQARGIKNDSISSLRRTAIPLNNPLKP